MSSVIVRIEIRFEEDVVHARQRARLVAELLGFDRTDQTRISTVVSEIARNACQYAGGGEVEFFIEDTAPRQLLGVSVRDRGPGIEDPQAILEGRYVSRTGMGLGIVGARRLMDRFDLQTGPGEGCTVSLGKTLPCGAAPVTAQAIERIGENLRQTQAHSPLEEIRQQNSELLRAMQELQQREQIVREQATQDELTGLPNRRLFYDRLNMAMAEARRNTRKLAVLFVDLDHFKSINDRLGHAAGDALLIGIAGRIKCAMREIDTLARIGGDEFALVLPQLESGDGAGHVAQRILDAMKQEMSIDGAGVQASVSIGIAIFPDDGMDTAILLQGADQAMYRAKQGGRNAYRYWDANPQGKTSP